MWLLIKIFFNLKLFLLEEVRNKTEKLRDLLQFMWQPVVQQGPELSISTSPCLSSRWYFHWAHLFFFFSIGLIWSPPQCCVLLRAETMTDLAQEINLILVKWLIALVWCRFQEASLYIILLTLPCPSGWAGECVGIHTCVHMCAF